MLRVLLATLDDHTTDIVALIIAMATMYIVVKSQLNELAFDSYEEYGGGGRIRTIEGGAGRFTVCSLWPLGNPSRVFLYLERVFPTHYPSVSHN